MKHMSNFKRQKGNALLNVAIAIFLGVLIAVVGVPKIQSYLVEAAIPPVSDEIQRFITRTVVSAQGTGNTPYAGLDQAYFAQQVRNTSLQVGAVSGQGTGGTIVRHGLGGRDTGTITLAETGTAFTLTFANVNNAACPGLATTLSKSVDDISINGTVVKSTDNNKTVTTQFTPMSAANECNDGDTNAFVFTVR